MQSARGYMIPYDQVIPGTNLVIRMIPVPGGSIHLEPPIAVEATNDSAASDATPPQELQATQVSVSPFWISETEITMGQLMPYRQLYFRMKKKALDRSYKPLEVGDWDGVSAPTDVYAPEVHFERATPPDAAAPSTTQYMARQYTKWLSLMTKQEYRLPMRSEWQHACRAKSTQDQGTKAADDHSVVTTAIELGRYAAYRATGEDSLLVRRKMPNAWGLFDMQGNAAEWVIEDTATTGLRYGHVAMGGHLESSAEGCQCDSMIRSDSRWWDEDPDIPPSPWWTTSNDGLLTDFRIIAPLNLMSAPEKQIAWEPDSPQLF